MSVDIVIKLHYYNVLMKLLLKLTSIPKKSLYVDIIKKQDQRLIIFDLLSLQQKIKRIAIFWSLDKNKRKFISVNIWPFLEWIDFKIYLCLQFLIMWLDWLQWTWDIKDLLKVHYSFNQSCFPLNFPMKASHSNHHE